MTRLIGAAVLALTLMLGGSAAIRPAAAAPLRDVAQSHPAPYSLRLSAITPALLFGSALQLRAGAVRPV